MVSGYAFIRIYKGIPMITLLPLDLFKHLTLTVHIHRRNMSFKLQSASIDNINTVQPTDAPSATILQNNNNTNSGTTVFVEDDISAHGKARTRIDLQSFGPPKYDQNAIANFMAKPVIIWQGSLGIHPANSNLHKFEIGTEMLSHSIWTDKIQGYGMIRGTANIRVQVNAQPFQQGRLLLHFLPLVSRNSTLAFDANTKELTHNNNLMQKTQHPNVEMDLGETSCEMAIPYIGPCYYYNLLYPNQRIDWGTAYLDVLSPLLTGAGGVESVEITMWMYFTDVELSAPTFQKPVLTSQYVLQEGEYSTGRTSLRTIPRSMARIGSFLTKEEKSGGIIDSALDVVQKAVSSVTETPILGSVAKGVASLFGWSKPIDIKQADPCYVHPTKNFMNSTGSNTSDVLALSSDSHLEVISGVFGADHDEMSFQFLKRIPTFYRQFSITTDDLPGSRVFSIPISPSLFKTDIDVSPYDGVAFSTPPFGYISRLFRHWRGSFDLTFKFVKTDFHSCRIVISFTPASSPSALFPTLTETALVLRDIVDIRTDKEITVNVPYLIERNYLDTLNYGASGDNLSNAISGTLNVHILNTLQAPQTCAQSMQVLVYVAGGDDLDFACLVPHENAFPVIPKATDTFAEIKVDNDYVLQDGIGGGEIVRSSRENNLSSMADPFASMKQLLNVMTPLSQTASINPTTGPGPIHQWTYAQHSFGINSIKADGSVTSPLLSGDFVDYVSTGYALYRGGMRVMTTSLDLDNLGGAQPLISSSFENQVNFVERGDSRWAIDGALPLYGIALNAVTSYQRGGNYVTIPFYGRTPLRNVWHLNGKDPNESTSRSFLDQKVRTLFFTPAPRSTASNEDVSQNFRQVLRGGADDLSFGYFIGFAPLLN